MIWNLPDPFFSLPFMEWLGYVPFAIGFWGQLAGMLVSQFLPKIMGSFKGGGGGGGGTAGPAGGLTLGHGSSEGGFWSNLGQNLMSKDVLAAAIPAGLGLAGGMLGRDPNERYVMKDEHGNRLSEKYARYTGLGLTDQYGAAVARSTPRQRINYNVPLVAGPGVRSTQANLYLPMTQGGYVPGGGISLDANLPPGYGAGYTTGTPTLPTGNTGNGGGDGFTPTNTVPPYGVQGVEGTGEDSQTVGGLEDEQQKAQDIAAHDHQTQLNTILTNLNGNGVDNTVGDSILSGTGSEDLKAGDLAHYNEQVWDTREVWEDTPSQAEDWAWKGNYTGVDDSGKFSWGADKKVASEPLPEWAKTQQG